MHCSKCGSSRVYPTPVVYRAGRPKKGPAALGAEEANPFEGNYLDLSPAQLEALTPDADYLVPRDRPVAAILATPPAANSYAGPLVSLAIGLFLAGMLYLMAEGPWRYAGLLCLLPGAGHVLLAFRYNSGPHKVLAEQWEHSSMCVTCGYIART